MNRAARGSKKTRPRGGLFVAVRPLSYNVADRDGHSLCQFIEVVLWRRDTRIVKIRRCALLVRRMLVSLGWA